MTDFFYVIVNEYATWSSKHDTKKKLQNNIYYPVSKVLS